LPDPFVTDAAQRAADRGVDRADPGHADRWRIPRASWLAAGALVLAIGLALAAAQTFGPKNLRVVTPGVLYRSAFLDAAQLGGVVDRLGVRTVVNLRSERENASGDWHARERAALDARGVELVDIPMHTGWPPGRAEIETWLALVEDPARQPVLVHCEYGIVRTGMMSAVYQIEVLGRDPKAVWADFEYFGSEIREPERSRIAAFVAGYLPLAQRDR
jgi:protein tyrosine/serine phosphatase